MSVSDILRYAVLTIVALVLLIFGMKWLGQQRTEKEIISELRTLTSPSSSFEQFNAEDTRKTLFRTLYHMHRAKAELDMPPDELLDKVFKMAKPDGFMGDPDPYTDHDPGRHLVRDSLIANYEKSNRLGIFSDSVGLESLRKGEAAQIHAGEQTGKWIAITHIISPEVSPGIEKIVPNLVVGPPRSKDQPSTPTEFDIARAKQLANTLHRANQLEREAMQRIVAHYDQLAKPGDPETAPPPAPPAENGN